MELCTIRRCFQREKTWKMFPPSMVCRIRHLKICEKHIYGRIGGIAKENKLHGNQSVCVDNLIKINTKDSDHTVRNVKSIACSLLNAKSLKKNRSNGPELIGLVRRCTRLYIEKQQNKKAGYFTNGVTMFYS